MCFDGSQDASRSTRSLLELLSSSRASRAFAECRPRLHCLRPSALQLTDLLKLAVLGTNADSCNAIPTWSLAGEHLLPLRALTAGRLRIQSSSTGG